MINNNNNNKNSIIIISSRPSLFGACCGVGTVRIVDKAHHSQKSLEGTSMHT